jgi:hypothetical protein
MSHKTTAAAKLRIFVSGASLNPHFEKTTPSFSFPFVVALMYGNLDLIHSTANKITL